MPPNCGPPKNLQSPADAGKAMRTAARTAHVVVRRDEDILGTSILALHAKVNTSRLYRHELPVMLFCRHVKSPQRTSAAIPKPEAAHAAVPTLRERKLRAVRESIWDVAMDLFAANGYDETTVEDIARAAGISLRSFFRYFLSKGDLMSYALLLYGHQLAAAIDACPPDSRLREVFRESIFNVAHLGLTREARTRKHLAILSRSQA